MAPSRRAKAVAADPAKVAQQAVDSVEDGLREHQLRIRRYDNAYEVYRGAYQPVNRDVRAWQSRLRVKYGMLSRERETSFRLSPVSPTRNARRGKART